MNKNKILISAFLLIFFFSLNSVSAMDDVDNAVIASDNQVISGEDNLIQSSLDDDIISGDNNQVVVNNGDSIQSAIDNATAGSTIIVESGIYSEDLVIPKGLSIIGNNAVLKSNKIAFNILPTANYTSISGFDISVCQAGLYRTLQADCAGSAVGHHPAAADHHRVYHIVWEHGAVDDGRHHRRSRHSRFPVLYGGEHLLDVLLINCGSDLQYVYPESSHHGEGVLSAACDARRDGLFAADFVHHTARFVPDHLGGNVDSGRDQHSGYAYAAADSCTGSAHDGIVRGVRYRYILRDDEIPRPGEAGGIRPAPLAVWLAHCLWPAAGARPGKRVVSAQSGYAHHYDLSICGVRRRVFRMEVLRDQLGGQPGRFFLLA